MGKTKFLIALSCLAASACLAEDAYIESDGTQAILTDCTVTPETCIVADFRMLAVEGQARIFGTVVDPSAEFYVDGTKTNGGNFAFGFGDTWTKSDVVPADLGRHVATLDLGKRIYSLETDDETVLAGVFPSKTETKLTTHYPLAVFAKVPGPAPGFEGVSQMRLYSLKVYEGNTLRHEYLPRSVDGKGCLCDRLTGRTFFDRNKSPRPFRFGGTSDVRFPVYDPKPVRSAAKAPRRKSRFAPITTRPGALDFVKGHIQGIALTDDVIYLSHIEGIVKIDWQGNVITNVEARRHMGDIEVVDGIVYGTLGKTKDPHTGLGGTAYVTTFRADDLAHVGEDVCLRHVAPGIDGIAYLNGFFYVGGGRLGGKESPVRNLVVKLDRDLKPVKSANLDRGWKTRFGVQDVAAVGREVYLFFYPKGPKDPSCVVVDEDLNWLRTVDLWGGNGVKALPPRFGKSECPRFLVCRTYGVPGSDVLPLTVELRFVEIRGGKVVDLYDAGL